MLIEMAVRLMLIERTDAEVALVAGGGRYGRFSPSKPWYQAGVEQAPYGQETPGPRTRPRELHRNSPS